MKIKLIILTINKYSPTNIGDIHLPKVDPIVLYDLKILLNK